MGLIFMPCKQLHILCSFLLSYLISDIEPDFKTELRSLVPLLLSPENLVIKEISGSHVTGQGLLEYFKVISKLLKMSTLCFVLT